MGYVALPFAVIDVARQLLKNDRCEDGACLSAMVPLFDQGKQLETAFQRRQDMEFNKEYDASGLACPLPIVKTKKALADMTSGHVLRVLSTDPGSVCDMAAFAEQTGNALLEQGSENGKFVFYLKKA